MEMVGCSFEEKKGKKQKDVIFGCFNWQKLNEN
jgi:hypothetical protein